MSVIPGKELKEDGVEAAEFAVEYLRPDGWWEAGRGWDNREAAEADAADKMRKGTTWRVIEAREPEYDGPRDEPAAPRNNELDSDVGV